MDTIGSSIKQSSNITNELFHNVCESYRGATTNIGRRYGSCHCHHLILFSIITAMDS